MRKDIAKFSPFWEFRYLTSVRLHTCRGFCLYTTDLNSTFHDRNRLGVVLFLAKGASEGAGYE